MQKKILTGIQTNACVEFSDSPHMLCQEAILAGIRTLELNQSDIGTIVIDQLSGKIGFANTAMVKMLGFKSMEEVCATPLERLYITQESREDLLGQIAAAPQNSLLNTMISIKHADGTLLKARLLITPYEYENIKLVAAYVIDQTKYENKLQLIESVLHLLHLDDELLTGDAFFEKLFKLIQLFIPNVDGMVIARNLNGWVNYVYTTHELTLEPHEIDANNEHMSDKIILTGETIIATQPTQRGDMYRIGVPTTNHDEKINGSLILESHISSIQPGPEEKKIIQYINTAAATKLNFHALRLEQEKQITQLKTRDKITGLLNRESFLIELDKQLRQNIHGSLFVLDIKNFRKLNISLGDEGGNKILQQVARWLQSLTIENTLGRLSNDEFALFTPEITENAHVVSTVHDILNILHRPILQEEQNIFLNFRIGIAINNSTTAIKILEHATTALLYAKKDQTPQAPSYLIYNEQTKSTLSAQEQLERDVLQAYVEKEITIYIQPKYSLDGKLIGGETLLRMTGKYAHITPDQFIPIFESHGLISEITFDVVLEQTGKILANSHHPGAVISINIAPQTLHDARLVEKIQTVLKKYKIQPAQLELEITERMVNEDNEHPENSDNIETLMLLQKNGHIISLDDFGTAYSNLYRFGTIPFDTIKIDKSFLGSNTLIQTILNLARGFQKKVVIEGVENSAQLQIFRAPEYADIPIAVQGFLFGKPMLKEKYLTLRKTIRRKAPLVAVSL